MAGTKKVAGATRRGVDGRYKPRSSATKRPQAEDSAREERPAVAERPLRPSQCRVYLRRELAHSFRGIVQGFVKQAESGSVQHLKLTTELLDAPGPQKRRKGSAQMLLEKLERIGREGKAEAADAEAKDDFWPE